MLHITENKILKWEKLITDFVKMFLNYKTQSGYNQTFNHL